MKNSRSMGRLIWFHVPPRLSPKTAEETASGRADRSKQEMMKVMAEKQMALDLVEAFAVALKHHIRGVLPALSVNHLLTVVQAKSDSTTKICTTSSGRFTTYVLCVTSL